MGTNYYAYRNVCERCGRGDEPLHIGKSSAGWCFSLHVYPELGLTDWPEWEEYLAKVTSVVRDEYGEAVTLEGLRQRVTERAWNGQPSSATWLRENHAVAGPKGLARHCLNDRCIKNGAGTWDCLVGDFS